MKHIGWCLEQIQITMIGSSGNIDTPEEKKRALWAINKTEEYLKTLLELVNRPDFKKTLYRLKNSSVKDVQLQEQEIEKLINDIRYTTNYIGLSLEQAKGFLKEYDFSSDHAARWKKTYDAIVHLIDQKFGGERGELKKEFEAVLHTEKELKQIVSDEKHLASMLK